MRLLDKYFVDFPRAPDGETGSAEPVAEAIELVAEPEVAEEVTPESEATPPAPVNEGVPKWALERIGEETSKRQAVEERERAALERAASLEEIVRRLQSEPKGEQKPVEQHAPAKPAAEQSSVEQAAAQLLLQRDLRGVSDSGVKAYGAKWADAVNALNAYGANTTDFVASVLEIDPSKAHEIMFQIAQDGEKAVQLAKMSPIRRATEITRMVDAMSAKTATDAKPAVETKPETKPVSRAPTPKPAMAPLAAAPDVDPRTPDGNDKMSDKDWERWYKSKEKRSA